MTQNAGPMRVISVMSSLVMRKRRLTCAGARSEEHTSELQSRLHLVCRLLLEKKHRDAVDAVVRPHRPLLVPDHDELGAVGIATKQLDEAPYVRIVDRVLDLFEEVARTRPLK